MTLPALGSVPNALVLAGVTSPTDDDTAKMTLLVAHASAAIRNYTGQAISSAAGTDQLAGVWGPDLELPRRPITAVDSVTIDGVAATGWEWDKRNSIRRSAFPVGNGAAPTYCDDDWPPTTQGATGYSAGSWGGPRSTIAVTYTAGYAATPEDIAAICEGLAAAGFAAPPGVRSEALGSYQVTYAIESLGGSVRITIYDAKALNRYRKRSY